jgi:DNA-3-methyladenine glycosylase II
MKTAAEVNLKKAAEHLARQDPILAPVIAQNGFAKLMPHTDYYGALVNSIIGQQLSVKAAATIKARFRSLFDGHLPSADQILNTSVEDLRAVGFSNAKANYVRDLAQHIIDGRVRFDTIDSKSNQEIISELTDVKGIGEWTAHMFLMFCMGRLDVLPVGDLGIRNGVRKLYGLEHAPTPQQITEIAANNGWHPYESVASWYVWRALDADFKTQ